MVVLTCYQADNLLVATFAPRTQRGLLPLGGLPVSRRFPTTEDARIVDTGAVSDLTDLDTGAVECGQG